MTTSNNSSVLKDVIAYVDVWSSDKRANYAKPFVQQLQEMGAQVSKTFSKQVTHVVFSNGHPATWRKAKKSVVRLVSVLWVDRCYDEGERVDEELYPAVNDESNPVMKNKRHRCMQPKDSPERTPENDRRMKKKLDKMMKGLAPKQTLVTDVSPIIIDEENGIIYSPAWKRSDYMAQRLKDMKEKRENISPTASQMVESSSPTGLKPCLGSTPTVLKFDQSDDDSSASVAEPTYSPDKEEGRTKVDVKDHNHCTPRHRKGSNKPWISPSNDGPKQISSPVKCPDFKDEEDGEGMRQKKSRSFSVRKKPAEKHKAKGLLEGPSQDRKSDNSKHLYKNLPDKEKVKAQVEVNDHDLFEPCHRKGSNKPPVSPCHNVPKLISSPVKCPDFKDEEDGEGTKQKKLRRASVRKQPAEKHKAKGLLESPSQDQKRGKNLYKEKRRSPIKSSSPTPNKSEKGIQKIKASKSLTETKTHLSSDAANSSSLMSPPVKLRAAAIELSKETATPLQKTAKRARTSLSALVRSFALSGDSKTVASGSTDGDNDVFEDYFSPVNHISKRPPLPNLPVERDIQIPFELQSVPKKRKQRRSESIGSEATSKKKRKLDKIIKDQQCDASSEPQSQPQLDVEESLLALESPRVDAPIVTKRQRQSTLPFAITCTARSAAVKQRRSSTSVQSTMLREPQTKTELLKNSDVSVPSHALESRGNVHAVAAGSTEIPSEGEEDNHNKQISLSLQKMVNKTKAMRTLVMTSMPTEKQHTVDQVVSTLGGFTVVDRVCESTTHVVSGAHRRTLNILLGIARGCWILSFEWILWCLEQRQWIPEEPYELSEQFPAAQICRLQRHLSAGEHQQDLFQGQPAMFVSRHSQPPTQSLVELIQLCGGTICKTVRQAGICIGKYSGRRPEGSRILSEQWVLDSITRLKRLSYDDYNLE
ncbi:microcephalin isoform X2 [Centropristis striata]|uniref:microcephalin isoform X2 n=1 Tax=Centropristis striata TaxID=184440 RepID=UPI0027DFD322|nr:microcephalin isoform X2 [Centropristis striata]